MPERDRWRALFEHSTDLVLVHEIGANGRPGRILEINPAACRRLGVSREEALRLSPRDFAVGLDETRIAEINARLRHDGELAFDARARPRMGSEFPIEVRSRLFEFEDRTVSLLIARDISQRWHLEQQLREREAWYRTLITNTLDTITVAAPDGTLRFVSPSITATSGWEPAEVVGRNGFDLIHPDDQPQLRATLERLVGQPGTQARSEFRMRRRNGEWFWVETLATSRVDDPLVRGVIICSRDITQRRTLDEQLRQSQKLEALGRLAGGVAHDFNNLLTAVVGYASLLELRAAADPATVQTAVEIRRAGERAADLARQLLTFGRRQPASPQVVSANAVLGDLQRMLRRLIGEDVRIAMSLAAAPDRIRIDPGQLEQVVVNLAVNARDAMPRGGELRIATVNAEGRLLLTVADDGTGMDEQVRVRAFEPFFTTKEPGRGSGLGLSVVWGIVHDAGGDIRCDSTPGAGTRFTIDLPLTDATPAETTAPAPAPLPAGGGETVLLAEDEDQVRLLLETVLTEAGMQVIATANGPAALAAAASHSGHIDLLITDVVMPQMGGDELAHRLRRARAGLRVLFISGYSASAIEAGPGDSVLCKPFSPIALLRQVRELLDRGPSEA